MFINEFTEGSEFGLGKGVHGTNRRGCTILQVDVQIVRAMRSQRIGLSLAEDVSEVVVLFGNMREVGGFVGDGSRTAGGRNIGEVNSKTLCSGKFTGTGKGGCTY
jgi:hypothetical protein